jgi:hypothetical protein
MMTTKNLHDNAERPQCWTYEGEIIRAQLITWWLEEKFLFDKFRQSKVYCYSSQQNSQNTRDLKLQQWLGDRSIKFLIIFSVDSHYCFRSCRLIWVFMEINTSSTTVLFSFLTSVSLFVCFIYDSESLSTKYVRFCFSLNIVYVLLTACLLIFIF